MSLDERLRHELRRASRLAVVDPESDRRAGRALADRHRRRQRRVLAAAVVVLVAGAAVTAVRLTGGSDADTITGAGSGPGSGPDHPQPTAPSPEGDAPPHVVVSSVTRSVELEPFTYCWSNGCADGFPPDPPEDLGADDELEVAFPLPDWTFTATLTLAGDECPRAFDVPLEPSGEGTYRLPPAGPAGTYDVSLFGQGQGGDVAYAFRWTTSGDGPLPEPEARVAVLADNDGMDSYGVELELSDLAGTPVASGASIIVRAADGSQVTLQPAPQDLCRDGVLYWTGSPEEGRTAAALADAGPFTYEVTVVLDGVTYRATATWPDDVIPGNEPSVPLHFEPALPAMAYE